MKTFRTIQKVIRAFFTALVMTLRGQSPPPRPTPASKYPALYAWIRQGAEMAERSLVVTNKSGVDQTARLAIRLTIEGRETSMEAILGGIRFHLVQEYYYLLQNETSHSLTAIYASNLNDQFRLARLSEALKPEDQPKYTEIINELVVLKKHLESIPPSNTNGN